MKLSPYAVLSCSRDASDEAVREAYRTRLGRWHPDRFLNLEPEVQERVRAEWARWSAGEVRNPDEATALLHRAYRSITEAREQATQDAVLLLGFDEDAAEDAPPPFSLSDLPPIPSLDDLPPPLDAEALGGDEAMLWASTWGFLALTVLSASWVLFLRFGPAPDATTPLAMLATWGLVLAGSFWSAAPAHEPRRLDTGTVVAIGLAANMVAGALATTLIVAGLHALFRIALLAGSWATGGSVLLGGVLLAAGGTAAAAYLSASHFLASPLSCEPRVPFLPLPEDPSEDSPLPPETTALVPRPPLAGGAAHLLAGLLAGAGLAYSPALLGYVLVPGLGARLGFLPLATLGLALASAGCLATALTLWWRQALEDPAARTRPWTPREVAGYAGWALGAYAVLRILARMLS